jgi:WD40 repeat protein
MRIRFFLGSAILSWFLSSCAQVGATGATTIPTLTQFRPATSTIKVSPTTITPTLTPQPTPAMSVLSIANISQIQQVNTLETDFYRFIWSPDSRNLLIISPKIAPPSQVSLINVSSLETVWSKNVKDVHDGDFGLNGQEIVLATDKALVFVNADTGAELRRMTCTGAATTGGFFSDFEMVSFRPDGQSVAYGHTEAIRQEGEDAYVYVTNSSKTCDAGLLQKLADNRLNQLEFSPDGKYLMGVFSRLTFLWKTSNHEQYAAFKTDGFSAFNGDGSLLATAYEREVTLWDVNTLKPVGFYEQNAWSPIALNPAGSILAVPDYLEKSDYTGWIIKLWDTKTGDVLQAIRDLPGTPSQINFSPDGRLLAAQFYGENSSDPRKLVIWGVK